MKLTVGLALLGNRNVEKTISKKILLANTIGKTMDKKTLDKSKASASDPVYFTNANSMVFNPDIRYRNTFAFSPLTNINYRNDLLVFSENNEVKKAVNIIANEIVIVDSEANKYPVFPKINHTLIPEDKKQVAEAIENYLNQVFYPKLYKYLGLKEDGLIEKCKEFITCGKVAWEIIYDDLKNPKDIVGMMPIDPGTLQKTKYGDYVYYVQKPLADNNGKERIMHENQVVLCEFNKYDYGYVSYVDKLRMSFNIMRSMMTSKALWFAAKSQVRMHIKLALGDVGRVEAIQKLTESKNQYINHYTFSDTGEILFNNAPNNSGYREFFTAETAASGSPEIEEINSNGPDLTEVDSLQYWEKMFWKDTEIPYDRIDPNASDSWGFTDVAQLRKVEINFGKLINSYRKMLNPMFVKPITVQLTLKETEIGADLSLLDSIKMEWLAFNQYDKLAELEVKSKQVELATNIAAFGETEDVNGKVRKTIPLSWITKNYLDFNQDQLDSMEFERRKENVMLGFEEDTTPKDEESKDENTTKENNSNQSDEENFLENEETPEDIMKFDDEKF